MECVLSLVDFGTELRCLVATTGGGVIGRARLDGPSNPRYVTAHAFRRRVEKVVGEASRDLADAVCLSVTASVWADPGDVRDLLAEQVTVDAERIRLVPLEQCALAGATGTVEAQRAIVVTADVSSRGWGTSDDGKIAACGGFGEILGDEGSTYAIGLAGLRAALRAFERRSRNTELKGLLLEHFRVESHRELTRAEHEIPALDRYAIAGFAAAVFEAARRDDAVAVEILEQAGRDLATLGLALINELDLIDASFQVLPIGTAFDLRGPLLETFIRTLKNKTAKANLIREGLGATAGGVLLAVEHLGLKVRPVIAETLGSSLQARR